MDRRYESTRIEPDDPSSGFDCGERVLDDYFARHALPNDRAGVNKAYVLRRGDLGAAELPPVIGFFTISMGSVQAAAVDQRLESQLSKVPAFPKPVVLIGRFAIDRRAQRQGFGEKLLFEAFGRVIDVAGTLGCVGIVVDAKNERAEKFYTDHEFIPIVDNVWPRRMFLWLGTLEAFFVDG